MIVPQQKLEKYRDFVNLNSTNGVYEPSKGQEYDPEMGLQSLLAILTPDSKALTFWVMRDKDVYYSRGELRSSLLGNLADLGLERSFPVSAYALWAYCEYKYKGEIKSGSLVDIGAVVRETYLDSLQGTMRGYHATDAGIDLALPLVFNAIEFVYRSRTSKSRNPLKYDSMWRNLGSVNSTSDNRRQLSVYKILKLLVENSGEFTEKEIAEALSIDVATVSEVLNTLGNSKLIDYDSTGKDAGGKRVKGWSTYSLNDKNILEQGMERIFPEIKKIRPMFSDKAYLSKVVEFVLANSGRTYDANALHTELRLDYKRITRILPSLADIGALKHAGIFRRIEKESIAKANYFTRMFYDMVLQPAFETASGLNPISVGIPEPDKFEKFMTNYGEEKGSIGPLGREEIRASILQIMQDGQERKKSHIYELMPPDIRERVGNTSLPLHLAALLNQKNIVKSKRGHYRLR